MLSCDWFCVGQSLYGPVDVSVGLRVRRETVGGQISAFSCNNTSTQPGQRGDSCIIERGEGDGGSRENREVCVCVCVCVCACVRACVCVCV